MRNRRLLMAWCTFLLAAGGIGTTIGYGLYYRSAAYREGIREALEVFFGLPVDLAEIRPYGFTSREMTDLEIWLPERRASVFRFPRIIWDTAGEEDVAGTVLDIYDGTLAIGSQEWQENDYMRVLRASLKHNFQELGIDLVRFHNTRMDWPRSDFHLQADGVNGEVVFDARGRGRAELTCRRLNGVTTTEAIRIAALLDPEQEDFLPEVALTVPSLPLSPLGLHQLLQAEVTQGSFAGRIVLRQRPEGDRIELAGQARKIRLAEWTQRLPGGGIPALLDVSIEEVVLKDLELERVALRGQARELEVDSLLRQFGWPAIGGTARLIVRDMRIVGGTIEELSLAGEWNGGDLDGLAQAVLDETGIEGKIDIRINALVIENNKPVSGDIVLIARPTNGETGTINRELLIALVNRYLKVELPPKLFPEQVAYVQMGARLLIDREQIRVLAAPGPAGPALVTTRLMGQDIPLLPRFQASIPLDPILVKAIRHFEQLKEMVRETLLEPVPSSAPGGP